MIDFHTHILPGIDDGSRSTEESLRMLQAETEQGITEVIATPHFYAHRTSVGAFLERRERAFGKLQELYAGEQTALPKMRLGCEVYFFDGINDADLIERLTVQDTRILLLEMPFSQWSQRMYEQVRSLVRERNFTVVLAHLERFWAFQRDRSVFDRVMDLPVYVQMNAETFLTWRGRRTAGKILQYEKPWIMGSDCHRSDRRVPNMKEACDVLRRKYGQDTPERINEQSKRLLGEYAENM